VRESCTCCLLSAASGLDACGDATTGEEAFDSLASWPSVAAPEDGESWGLEAWLVGVGGFNPWGERSGSSSFESVELAS
jgi:hypothetical protein